MRVTAVLLVLLAACAATAAGPATTPSPAPPIPPKPTGAIPQAKQFKDALDKAKSKIAENIPSDPSKVNHPMKKAQESAKKWFDKVKNPFSKMGKKAYSKVADAADAVKAAASDESKKTGKGKGKGSWGMKNFGGMFSNIREKLKAQATKFKNARGDGAHAAPRAS